MIKYFLVFAVLLAQIPNIKCKIPTYKDNSNEIFIQHSKVAAYVVKRFISPKTSTLVLDEHCHVICTQDEDFHGEIVNNILSDLYEHMTVQLFLGTFNDRLWDYTMFIVDSLYSIEYLLNTFPLTIYERYFNFLILMTNPPTNAIERNKFMSRTFEISLTFNVRNVVIMINSMDNNQSISFYSYEMFSEDNCGINVTIKEINRYENGSLQHDFLFPDYISDFHGCVLNVSAHEIPPILSFKGDANNETHLMESYRLSGVEGDLLNMIAKELNFKYRLNFSNEENNISKYQTSTGCFGNLDENRAHVAIGGLSSTKSNSEKYSKSMVYHTTPYVFVIRSGLYFVPVKQLLNPLSTWSWVFIIIFVLTSVIFSKIIRTNPKIYNFVFGRKNKKPIASMFAIFFGVSIPTQIVPYRNFARFLLVAWLLLSFQIRNGYQGKMFDSLRFSKRIWLPQKISQLLQQDYILLAANNENFYPHNKTIIVGNVTERLDIVQNSTLRLTSTALLDSLAYYNSLHSNTSSLTYVQEKIYSFPCVMYFQKHSMLLSIFDTKLKIFSDAGITSHISKQHIRSEFQNMNTNTQFVSQLANENLIGLYLITGVMFLISFFVFILELLSTRSRGLRRIMDFLNSF